MRRSCASSIRPERYACRIGTVLFVYAHPDDESFVSGTPLRLAAAGHRTALLTLTRGDAGLWHGRAPGSWTGPELAAERAGEWAEAVRTIGYGWSRLLRYPDGRLADAPPEVVTADIVAAIRETRADAVVTFGPEGAGSEHPDHRAASFFTARAFARAALADQYPERGPAHSALRLYCNATPHDPARPAAHGALTPTHTIDISQHEERKTAAFACHRTQAKDRPFFDELLATRGGREHFHLLIDRSGTVPVATELL
jgi:LmbE family N-acetylglucosaminyl deacetylase